MGKKDAYWERVEKGEDPNSYAMRQLWKEIRAEAITAEEKCKQVNIARNLLRTGARV